MICLYIKFVRFNTSKAFSKYAKIQHLIKIIIKIVNGFLTYVFELRCSMSHF
ncbi:hypothetical protein HanIR_Chr06g0256731 [Helianthus annuus]|nr:hypothetical protein HanIR_Chr06g0256731 [Helianthus annuus]